MHSTCMTTATACQTGSPPKAHVEPLADTVSRSLNKATAIWRAWQRHRHALAALNAMPLDLRKDIGWPACDTPERT